MAWIAPKLTDNMATQVIPQLQAVDQVKHLSEAKPSFARVGYADQCEAAINEQVSWSLCLPCMVRSCTCLSLAQHMLSGLTNCVLVQINIEYTISVSARSCRSRALFCLSSAATLRRICA